MEFRMEFTPGQWDNKIQHADRLFLIGSCFTEQIGAKLSHHKFRTIENPHGILFNPVSITQNVSSYVSGRTYTESDLFCHDGIWGSWDHHTRFSHTDKDSCLDQINRSQEAAHQFLKHADWLIVTLGSAFAYRLANQQIVANCHKVPADKFSKVLLSASQVFFHFKTMLEELAGFNPGLKMIVTISPVRHLRDGFVENNRSKANLITAVHQLAEVFPNVFYFPAYELVMDDLRDYRFFAEDMVHPNYQATQYVWEKFVHTAVDDNTKSLMKEINQLQAARAHKPFQPQTDRHREFLELHLQKTMELKAAHPYLAMEDLVDYFKGL